jgi:hypothetical protein
VLVSQILSPEPQPQLDFELVIRDLEMLPDNTLIFPKIHTATPDQPTEITHHQIETLKLAAAKKLPAYDPPRGKNFTYWSNLFKKFFATENEEAESLDDPYGLDDPRERGLKKKTQQKIAEQKFDCKFLGFGEFEDLRKLHGENLVVVDTREERHIVRFF